eukprot:scaffold85886_cov19-Tisochrysis_lutea.AAC.3
MPLQTSTPRYLLSSNPSSSFVQHPSPCAAHMSASASSSASSSSSNRFRFAVTLTPAPPCTLFCGCVFGAPAPDLVTLLAGPMTSAEGPAATAGAAAPAEGVAAPAADSPPLTLCPASEKAVSGPTARLPCLNPSPAGLPGPAAEACGLCFGGSSTGFEVPLIRSPPFPLWCSLLLPLAAALLLSSLALPPGDTA